VKKVAYCFQKTIDICRVNCRIRALRGFTQAMERQDAPCAAFAKSFNQFLFVVRRDAVAKDKKIEFFLFASRNCLNKTQRRRDSMLRMLLQ